MTDIVTDDLVRAADVRARDLAYAYGPRPALRGVDLDVAAGERLAVTGPSGSGKTTLMHVLAGVIRPDAGEVAVGDHDLTALDDEKRSRLRRSEIGLLLQHGQLVDELTLTENVALPLMLGGRGRGEALATATSWLERVQVAEQGDQLATEVSAGQLQRAALARALVTRPRILLADEPTGALDSRASEQVMELIIGIADEDGTTLVVVTHDARVAAYVDREVVLRDGAVDGSRAQASAVAAGGR